MHRYKKILLAQIIFMITKIPYPRIPREAIGMFPQRRLVLEEAWGALERVGIPSDQLAESSTGVFIGISDYGSSLRECNLVQEMCSSAPLA